MPRAQKKKDLEEDEEVEQEEQEETSEDKSSSSGPTLIAQLEVLYFANLAYCNLF